MRIKIVLGLIIAMIYGCATTPLSQQVFGVKLPLYETQDHQSTASLTFSDDKQYESEKGVPLKGEPIICNEKGMRTTVSQDVEINPVVVPAGKEIVISNIISWHNAGITKTCWPFVKFIPEEKGEYVVVNERIGGKGASVLWTGAAFQTCEISVFKITEDGFEKIDIEQVEAEYCMKNNS